MSRTGRSVMPARLDRRPVGHSVQGAQQDRRCTMSQPIRRSRYTPGRWDPFGGFPGFDNLFDQMSQMLTSTFRDVPRISVNSWSPPVDVQETDEDYRVEADLPGVRPEDVMIDLQGKELRIVGEYGTAEQAGEE